MDDPHAAETDLSTLMDELTSAWSAAGLPVDARFPFELALEEIFVNAITHGAIAGETRHFDLRFSYVRPRATLVLRDDAPPFDPLSLAAPDLAAGLDERGMGGLGIHLVRELMDEVSYRRVDGRNELTLSKHID